MIYIIIGTDNDSHNEWVEPVTFENSLQAAERCQELNQMSAGTLDARLSYRVDTVEPSDNKTPTRMYADKVALKRETKARLSAEFGRNKMDHEEGYPYGDTDSIRLAAKREELRTADFTLGELFPVTSYINVKHGAWCCTELGG